MAPVSQECTLRREGKDGNSSKVEYLEFGFHLPYRKCCPFVNCTFFFEVVKLRIIGKCCMSQNEFSPQ